MGWFDNPIEEIKRTANDVVNTGRGAIQGVGNGLRSNLGSAAYFTGVPLASDYFNKEDNIKQAEADAEEAQRRVDQSTGQMDQLRAQQGLFAANLKKNALRDTGMLTNQAAANERTAMAQKLLQAKTNANSRGLLGSGFQKANEANARATAAANTASKQKQIQDLSTQQIQDAQNLQAQLGLEQGGIQQNMSDQYYRMAINNMNQRNQAYQNILTSGARLGGAYYGSRQPQSQQGDEIIQLGEGRLYA